MHDQGDTVKTKRICALCGYETYNVQALYMEFYTGNMFSGSQYDFRPVDVYVCSSSTSCKQRRKKTRKALDTASS